MKGHCCETEHAKVTPKSQITPDDDNLKERLSKGLGCWEPRITRNASKHRFLHWQFIEMMCWQVIWAGVTNPNAAIDNISAVYCVTAATAVPPEVKRAAKTAIFPEPSHRLLRELCIENTQVLFTGMMWAFSVSSNDLSYLSVNLCGVLPW